MGRLLFLAALWLPTLAAGQATQPPFTLDGNRMMSFCVDIDREITEQGAWCLLHTSGVYSGYMLGASNFQGRHCIPAPLPSIQVARILVKYMRSHPEQLHWDASVLTVLALHSSYQCPEHQRPTPTPGDRP